MMISRRTTLVISNVYIYVFYDVKKEFSRVNRTKISKYSIYTDELYDFLFLHDFPAYFCNLVKKMTSYPSGDFSSGTRNLKEFILRLHTGETIAASTPNWDWNQRAEQGQTYLEKLATDGLNTWYKEWIIEKEYRKDKIEPHIKELELSLELDGYKYQNHKLLKQEQTVLDEPESIGILESLQSDLELENQSTALHHLQLSEEHYLHERWDDSISNSRKYLECILQEVVSAHFKRMYDEPLNEDLYKWAGKVRKYLVDSGLLTNNEKEALSSIYGLLSETGGHPYMAQKDQARLLRDLALTFSQFVMLRYQGLITSAQ